MHATKYALSKAIYAALHTTSVIKDFLIVPL